MSRDWRYALFVVSVAAALRLVFAALIPAFPDETYYWEWSRHLAAGYFDHPPGLALLIRAGGVLLAPFGVSTTPLGIRLGPVFAGFIAALATIAIARRLAGDAAALRAAILISVLPLAAAGLILATPDAPVLATTALGLYGVTRALESEAHSARSLRWWAVTGVALGLAFSSKYTSIFLPVSVFIAIAMRPSLRTRLLEPGPYIACLIATVVFLPVLLWNAHHDWISFVFQLRHGLSAPQGSAVIAAWKHEGDLFGGQAGLASPILFVMLAVAVWRALRRPANDREFVLAMVATLSFGFFVYSAIRQRVEPNWPSPAYVPAITLLAIADWQRRGERWLKAGVIVAAAMSILIYAQGVAPILPLAPRRDPIARAFGWNELAHAADSVARATRVRPPPDSHQPPATWFAGDRYQEASELAFHLPSHPSTFATNLSGRVNQYDLWPGFPQSARLGDDLVIVVDDGDDMHQAVKALAPYFGGVRRSVLVRLTRGSGEIGTRRIWVLNGWHGGWPRH